MRTKLVAQENPLYMDPQVGAQVSDEQLEKVLGTSTSAQEGARLLLGGEAGRLRRQLIRASAGVHGLTMFHQSGGCCDGSSLMRHSAATSSHPARCTPRAPLQPSRHFPSPAFANSPRYSRKLRNRYVLLLNAPPVTGGVGLCSVRTPEFPQELTPPPEIEPATNCSCGLPSVVFRLRSAVCRLLSSVCCLPSVVFRLPSAVCRLPSVPAVCRHPSVPAVCRRLVIAVFLRKTQEHEPIGMAGFPQSRRPHIGLEYAILSFRGL